MDNSHGAPARQASLHNLEQQFDVTFEHAPVGIALVALDGTFLRANRRLCTILGRSEDELRQVRFHDITHPDDLAGDVERAEALLAGDVTSYEIQKRYLRPDGSMVWCRLTGSLVRDADGQPLHFVGHVADLSDLRRFDTSSVEHQHWLRTLVDGGTNFFVFRIRLQPAFEIEYLTEGVEAISGYRAEELRARPELIFERIHPDDAARLLRQMTSERATGTGSVFRWRHRDGREIWTRSSTVPVVEDGQTVAVEGIVTDITDQRTVEDQLVASEARFRSLVQNSTDVLFVTDRAGAITYVTPSVERVLGWTPDDVLGRDVWRFVHRDDTRSLTPRLAQPGAASGVEVVEARVRAAAGDWRIVEATVTNLVDDPAVQGVVINARDVTAQREAEAALRSQAVTDALTGLPNRTLLHDRVLRALTRHDGLPTMVAVLAVNVDRFRGVNETLGHPAGDELLVAIGERLARIVSERDTVARYGGDEFMVSAEGFVSLEQISLLADRIRAAVAEPLHIGATTVKVTASIGIAIAAHEGAAAEEVITSAGVAVKQAKSAGGDRVHVYDDALRERIRQRHSRERGLRRAIEEGELVAYFQPIVGLHDRRPVGAEALVRWQHPTEGLVPPNEFIPIAEETGLIVSLGDWVLDEACRRVAEWRRQPLLRDFTVSVNLAARQLNDAGITDRVAATLRRHALPPSALTLEVTESAALGDGHLERLREIHELGVAIALDDFGTHYSSLSYLQRLPVSHVKIDRSFVSGVTRDAQRRAIVTAVAQLARGLRLVSVAEGVEEDAEAGDLVLLGVDRGQGYLFGRPMPAEDLLATLS